MTSELLAGMDVSVSDQGGEYLAGIVGLKESVTSTYRKLGYDQIHMRMMYNKTREKIFPNLIFVPEHCSAFCLKIDRGVIIDGVMKSRSIRRTRIKREVVERRFDRNVFAYILEETSVFLHKHKKDVTDIRFECDSDSRNFVRGKGGVYTEPGIAHQLADIIAWVYMRNRTLEHVNYNDKTADLRSVMRNLV